MIDRYPYTPSWQEPEDDRGGYPLYPSAGSARPVVATPPTYDLISPAARYDPGAHTASRPASAVASYVPAETEASVYIPYQGDSWKYTRPQRKGPPGPRQSPLHVAGMCLFLLGMMASTIAAAYYILSCYGFG